MTSENVQIIEVLFGITITVLITFIMFGIRKLDRLLVAMDSRTRSQSEELAEHRTLLATHGEAIKALTIRMENLNDRTNLVGATCQAFDPWRSKLMADYELVPKNRTKKPD